MIKEETEAACIEALSEEILNAGGLDEFSLADKLSPGEIGLVVKIVANTIAQHEGTIKDVEDFHYVFQPETLVTKPIVFPIERRYLRLKLIAEELIELAEAFGEPELLDKLTTYISGRLAISRVEKQYNVVEVLDALTDLQYVLDGAYLEAGLHELKQPAFDEVHRSNMSKACADWIEAQETIAKYKFQEPSLDFEAVSVDDGRYIVKRDDGKICKSHRYSPANLVKIVNAFINRDQTNG